MFTHRIISRPPGFPVGFFLCTPIIVSLIQGGMVLTVEAVDCAQIHAWMSMDLPFTQDEVKTPRYKPDFDHDESANNYVIARNAFEPGGNDS